MPQHCFEAALCRRASGHPNAWDVKATEARDMAQHCQCACEGCYEVFQSSSLCFCATLFDDHKEILGQVADSLFIGYIHLPTPP